MSNFYVVSDTALQAIANAIRGVTGGAGTLQFYDEWVSALQNLPQIQVEPLSVTQNGTYTAQSGKAYSPITVNVAATQNVQTNSGTVYPKDNGEYIEVTCGFQPKFFAFGSESQNFLDPGLQKGVAGYWFYTMGAQAAGTLAIGGVSSYTRGFEDLYTTDTVRNRSVTVTSTGIIIPRGRQGNVHYNFIASQTYHWFAATF